MTCWNRGENFGSFGIGHFLWYPEGKPERFQEMFPELLTFLKANGVILPEWLLEAKKCPWTSREQFYENFNGQQMTALRNLLYSTRDLQAIFIAMRLEKAIDRITEKLPENQKSGIKALYERLANDPQGLYAMIDYLNFKGEGTSPSEGYKGQGWGLRQVLERIPPSSESLMQDFIKAAKNVLEERVNNSPPERNEKQWLKGWFNRIDTYADS